MDCILPGSSVHGILQARTLEWVATSFSRGSSPPRNQTELSCTAGRCFANGAMREATLVRLVKFSTVGRAVLAEVRRRLTLLGAGMVYGLIQSLERHIGKVN